MSNDLGLKERALREAMAQADPGSLAAATAMREKFPPELAAWALTQAELRKQAHAKFADANDMLFTRTGLEQATRPDVARWRAERLREHGITTVVDLGCGIGSDAMAMVRAGIDVIAVDADAETVEAASHNLGMVGARPAVQALAEHFRLPEAAAVFVDPARRNARGRSWRVEDFSPSWEFVADLLRSDRPVAAKLSPGFPKRLIEGLGQAAWVSHDRDVVELSLLNFQPPGIGATVLRHDAPPVVLDESSPRAPLHVAEVGHYIAEPDNAVIRAGLLEAISPEQQRWLLHESVAYLSSNEPIACSVVTNFRVLEVLDPSLRSLKSWARTNSIGALEIKVRGLDLDPAQLRRQLKLRGQQAATLILSQTAGGARAFVAQRCP